MMSEIGRIDPYSKSEIPQPKVDLIKETYGILSIVREPTPEEQEAYGKRGFVLLRTASIELEKVFPENPNIYSKFKRTPLVSELRLYVPPKMTIAIEPNHLFIDGSFDKGKTDQLKITEEASRIHGEKFPSSKKIMLPASVLAQADKAYQKITGKVLFTNRFARCLDHAGWSLYSANVGRYTPDDELRISDSDETWGNSSIGVLSAVVFVKDRTSSGNQRN